MNNRNPIRLLHGIEFPFNYTPHANYIPQYWRANKTQKLGVAQHGYYQFIDQVLPTLDARFKFLAYVLGARRSEFFESSLDMQELTYDDAVPMRAAVAIARNFQANGREKHEEVLCWGEDVRSDFSKI